MQRLLLMFLGGDYLAIRASMSSTVRRMFSERS